MANSSPLKKKKEKDQCLPPLLSCLVLNLEIHILLSSIKTNLNKHLPIKGFLAVTAAVAVPLGLEPITNLHIISKNFSSN